MFPSSRRYGCSARALDTRQIRTNSLAVREHSSAKKKYIYTYWHYIHTHIHMYISSPKKNCYNQRARGGYSSWTRVVYWVVSILIVQLARNIFNRKRYYFFNQEKIRNYYSAERNSDSVRIERSILSFLGFDRSIKKITIQLYYFECR